jgi:hypothetical protein
MTEAARFEVMLASMVFPADAYIPECRPPLDLPPKTPPPEPLPTNTFLWNAVGQPPLIDGFQLSTSKLQELAQLIAQRSASPVEAV